MKKLTMIFAALVMTVAMQAQTKFHDVEVNDAKGNVKSISMSVMGMQQVIEFSQDGKMSQEGMSNAKYDENGYMVSATMSMMGQTADVKFAWENGKLKSQTIVAGGQEIVQTLIWGEDGQLKAQKMTVMGQEVEVPFSDYKLDAKGNWISRKTSMMGQEMEVTRTITYYE